MTWSYSGDPASSPLDAVRFWLEDTQSARPLFSNEEVAYVQGLAAPLYDSDPIATAAILADIAVAKFSGDAAISADGVSVDVGGLADRYKALGEHLRDTYSRLRGVGAVPIVSGIDAVAFLDPSVRQPSFGKGFMDNPGAGNQEWGLAEFARGTYDQPDGGYWTGP